MHAYSSASPCKCRSYNSRALRDRDADPLHGPLLGEPEVLVSAGDDGRVRLFAYPCVVLHAPNR